MSGIELLLSSAIDYERTHQIVLYTLLQRSKIANELFGLDKVDKVAWEPEKQLFDLLVNGNCSKAYIELKMWSSLGTNQIARQIKHVSIDNSKLFYILLGSSWFEWDSELVQAHSENKGLNIGYIELIKALNNTLITEGLTSDVYDLVLAYRNSLSMQLSTITSLDHYSKGTKLYAYNVYRLIQTKINLKSYIYTVNNPGREVYILNNAHWHRLQINEYEVVVFYEVVDGSLCIKFRIPSQDSQTKIIARTELRKLIHENLDSRYELMDSGRTGEYMTICKLKHDFFDIDNLSTSINLFNSLHNDLETAIQKAKYHGA